MLPKQDSKNTNPSDNTQNSLSAQQNAFLMSTLNSEGHSSGLPLSNPIMFNPSKTLTKYSNHTMQTLYSPNNNVEK
jgi:hypothetical protein